MFNKKLNVNFQNFAYAFSIGSVGLLFLALILKIRTLIIVGELFIFLSIIGMIFGILFSIVSKYDKK